MSDVEMVETWINGRWPLLLPRHRHERPSWPWWEAARLSAMHHVISRMLERQLVLVLDVGAEEGDLPALWASWGANVALAEPNTRVWPNIRAVWDANGLDEPVLCWPGFLGAEPNNLFTAFYQGWPVGAAGPVISDHGFLNLCERPDVPVATVDVVSVDVFPPSIVTIDVEGAELEVLKGAVRTLVEHRPVVFVSIHPQFMWDMYQTEAATLHGWMEGFGYVSQFLATDHEEHWVFQHPDNMWLPIDR